MSGAVKKFMDHSYFLFLYGEGRKTYEIFFLYGAISYGQKELYASVILPTAPAGVPGQWPFVSSVTSVTSFLPRA